MNTIHVIDKFKRPIAARVRDVLNKKGVSSAQWQVINFLAAKKELRADELAEGAGVLTPSLSRIKRDLINVGILISENSTNDDRALKIRLTKSGKSLYKSLRKEVNAAMTITKDDIRDLARELKMFAG